jgi:hypothetical protein
MKANMTFFMIFMSLFYVVGFCLLGYALWSIKKSTEAGTWPTTPGTLKSAEIKSSSDSDGTTYEVKVAYSYKIGGQEYNGERLAYGYGGSSGREAHAEILEKLKAAKVIEVRYDPSDFATSTLSYGVHRSIQLMLAFAVTWLLFVFGFTMIWWLASGGDSVLLNNLSVR